MLTPEKIAEIIHEANRALSRTFGDMTHNHWDFAPQYQRDKVTNGVKNHLAQSKTPSPRASHEAWLKYMASQGWTYGPVKNEDVKQHPCMVAYDDLKESDKLKDVLFIAICKALKPSAVNSNPEPEPEAPTPEPENPEPETDAEA